MTTPTTSASEWRRPVYMTRAPGRDGSERVSADSLVASFIKDFEKGTQRAYLRHLTVYCLFLDRWLMVHPLDAQYDDVDHFLQYIAGNHPDGHDGPCAWECDKLPYTQENKRLARTSVRSFYDHLLDSGKYKGTNPVPRKRGRRKEGAPLVVGAKDILQPHEIADLVAAARAEGPRAVFVVTMLLGTWARCEEFTRCDVERLDRRDTGHGLGRTLFFERGKTGGTWQTIDIGFGLDPVIDAYLRGRTHGPMLMSEGRRTRNPATGELEHTRLDDSGIRRMLTRIGQTAGLGDRVHPHLFRDTGITYALTDPGTTLQRVSRYAGHGDINTTMKYYNTANLLRPGRYYNPYGPDWRYQAL